MIIVSCIKCKRVFNRNSSLATHSCYSNHHSFSGRLGYIASKITVDNRILEEQKQYEKNPKICFYCCKTISFERQKNIFCSQSCSATFNNQNRKNSGWSRTEESKKKTSATIKLYASENIFKYTKIYLNKCKQCNKVFYHTRKVKLCFNSFCKKENSSKNAKKNKLCGNFNRKSLWYISPIAGKVHLESSYEVIIAKQLDEHLINWCRPNGFEWKDDKNISRKYYPDFYLTDYNFYLDPKNDYLIKKDESKIKKVIEQNKINLLILNKNQLTWSKIKELMEPTTGFEPARGI